jgi:hypothetical protein
MLRVEEYDLLVLVRPSVQHAAAAKSITFANLSIQGKNESNSNQVCVRACETRNTPTQDGTSIDGRTSYEHGGIGLIPWCHGSAGGRSAGGDTRHDVITPGTAAASPRRRGDGQPWRGGRSARPPLTPTTTHQARRLPPPLREGPRRDHSRQAAFSFP